MTQLPSAPPGVVNRRFFLRAGGTGVLGAALAGCAPPGARTGRPGAVATTLPPAGPAGGPLHVFTWAGYEGSGVLDPWYRARDIRLSYKSIANESPAAVVKGPGGDQWDCSSVNQGDALNYYSTLGISTLVTERDVPNLAQLLPFFKNNRRFFAVADGTYVCVPWTWGPLGISYRQDRVRPAELSSWQDLLHPRWKNRIGTFDDGPNMIATAAVATGIDPSTVTREQLGGPIRSFLQQLKPNIKVLCPSIGDQLNTLVSGDVDIQLVGLTFFTPQAAQQKVRVGFLVPAKEGSYGFTDCVFIPPHSRHRANALAYANALLGGDTAVRMMNSLVQLSTNRTVNDRLRPDVRHLFPSDLARYSSQTLKWNKSYYDLNSRYATVQEWTLLWQTIKA